VEWLLGIGISSVEDFSEDLKALTLLGWMTAKKKHL